MSVECQHTEYAIPNDEHSTKVLVDAVTVDAVVNSMVTGRVQNVFQRTDLANSLQQ